MSQETPQPTYSIAVRLRRTTYEDAYVAVPVTDAVLRQDDDGVLRLDAERVMAAAVTLGDNPRAEWRVEERGSEPHPVQQAAPDGRTVFDPSAGAEP